MSKVMNQAEIDALFAQSNAARQQPEDAGTSESTARRNTYNFGRSGQISNEQMKGISTVNDLFARNLTHNLGAWLRTQFQVSLASGEQMVYSEFLDRIPQRAYVCSVGLEPLDTIGVVELDLSLAPPIVDLLLGGVGRAGDLRDPTDIEDQILLAVIDIIVRELNIAWQAAGLQFALLKRELEGQIARLMTPGEKILCVSFEIRMPLVRGELHLCLPAVVLNTILREVSGERGRPRRRSMEARTRLTELLNEVTFGAIMQLPKVRLRATDIAALQVGTILRLPLPSHSGAELRVTGLPIFAAQPVRSGEHRGALVQGVAAAHGNQLQLSAGV
jgi:flagellar motor switch protein FliM